MLEFASMGRGCSGHSRGLAPQRGRLPFRFAQPALTAFRAWPPAGLRYLQQSGVIKGTPAVVETLIPQSCACRRPRKMPIFRFQVAPLGRASWSPLYLRVTTSVLTTAGTSGCGGRGFAAAISPSMYSMISLTASGFRRVRTCSGRVYPLSRNVTR